MAIALRIKRFETAPAVRPRRLFCCCKEKRRRNNPTPASSGHQQWRRAHLLSNLAFFPPSSATASSTRPRLSSAATQVSTALFHLTSRLAVLGAMSLSKYLWFILISPARGQRSCMYFSKCSMRVVWIE